MAKQFSKDDLDALKQQILEMGQAQASMTNNLKSYAEVLLQVKENYRDIANVQNQVQKSETIIKDKAKEINSLVKKRKTAQGSAKDALNAQIKALLKEVELENDVLTINKENLKVLNQQNNSLKKNLNLYNASSAAVGSIRGGLKNVGKKLLEQIDFTSKIKSNFFEQSKAVKETELSMGILSTQSKAFSNTIFKASVTTNQLGVSAADLAQIQGDYSENIGRAVQLTDSGYQAMAELAQGTILGNEGATALASNMDKFNVSATRSRDLVEETLNIAHKMGVNAAKTTKNIEHSLKLAQKYNFKGGVKGAMQMAAFAAKTGFEMQEIAGLADKLFSPEGAVEMSAQLQVLGGEWAKLADPFALMYKARNDIAGLTEDLVKATTASAQFNKKTGELDISALEMHRLKEVADATGLSYENLANTARTTGKLLKIKASIRGIVDPDIKEFIANTAQFNEKTGKFEVKVDGENLAIDELAKYSKGNVEAALKQQMTESQSLKDRAKQAQTLQDTWQNIQNTFQSLFLPLFDGIQRGLGEPMQELFEYMQSSGIANKMAELGETVGSLVGGLAKFAIDNPITAVLGTITAIGIFDVAKWYLNGKTFGLGFNSVANASGDGGGDSLFGLGNTKIGKKILGSKLGSKFGKMGVGAKLATGVGTLGAGLLGDVAGGFASDSMGYEDSATGDIGSTVGGIAGGIIGSFAGPLGTALGASLGSFLGKLGGDALGSTFGDDETRVAPKQNDFVMRPGQAATPFSENDTLIGFKPGGPIDKLSETTNSSSGNMEVSFKPLKIEFGTIKLELNNNSVDIDLKNNPKFISDITIAIQEQLRMNLNGGKLAPNQAY